MTTMQRLALYAEPLLRFPYILRTRRNHGLEHATIHILNQQRYRLSGRSHDRGFVLIGDVPTEAVESAVQEALQRLKAGEHRLAVHPNCGTNLVTFGFLATLLAWIGFGGNSRRQGWGRFPTMMTLMMGIALFATPLGLSLQKHFTTEGDPGDMELVGITPATLAIPFSRRQLTLHRVLTQQSDQP